MIIGSPRLGIPTASNFGLIVTPEGKMGESQSRKAYMYKLVIEKITGQPVKETVKTEWMDRGIDLEDDAAKSFAKYIKADLSFADFLTTDDGKYGCTPDRLITGTNEAVEIKSPAPWNHVAHICDGPGNKYKPQIQGQLWIGEFEAVHFWSYCPGFPAVHRVALPDLKYRARMKEYLDLFLEDLDKAVEYVRKSGNLDVIEESMKDANSRPV